MMVGIGIRVSLVVMLACGGCYWESDWKLGEDSIFCGNSVVEKKAGETCDGDCPESCDDQNPCTIDEMLGSAGECNVVCNYEKTITECGDGDGCCPAGCDGTSDGDCSTSCGNSVIDGTAGETCDPPETCPADCDDEDPCTTDAMTGSAQNCNVVCGHFEITECLDGDGCCPAGCGDSDSDCLGQYPPGPYGTEVGDTVANFYVEECLCSGDDLTGSRKVWAEEFVEAKLTMLISTAGTCSECKVQAAILEEQFYGVYKGRGLRILYILFMDDQGNGSRDPLLDYCCRYKNQFKMTFTVAADPGDWAMGKYHTGIPLTMLLDGNMQIKFKEDGIVPSSTKLKQSIEDLL
jgi:hypothetical protein